MPNRLYTIIAILVFAFATNANGYAQSAIDQYKYIIIPKQFGFLKKENQFRVNSTTKYLFDQNGFTTLMQGENYPADLRKNPCLAAKVDILDESSAFTTKLYVVLIDCHDEEVFRTVMGKSREKSYDKTYIYALNNAFVSFETLSYSYNPAMNEQEPQTAVVTKEPEAAVATTAVTNVDSGTKPVSEPPASDPLPSSKTDAGTTAAAAGAGVAAGTVAAKESSAKESSAKEETATEEVSTAVAAAPVEEESPVSAASSYGNENVAFLLIQQGDKLVAYVSDDRNPTYKKGEMIGTLVKTSLPNVFRASWKHMDKDIDLTTAYFDDQGNLKIDVERGDKIEVLTFKKE
jgi:hypothetical protein